MTLNDFKAVEGDRRMGVRSLPVQLGVQRSAKVACAFMLLPQFVVVMMLISWGAPVPCHHRRRPDPAAGTVDGSISSTGRSIGALLYSGFGVPLFVAGMMVSAFALRAMVVATP